MNSIISYIAFLFIIFIIVSGGFISHILSCQMLEFLQKSYYMKHILGIILIFMFIMLEGGWDFNSKENDKAIVDWASGNTVHTMIFALIIYIFFLISSKSKLIPNIILYSVLFIVYFIDSYRKYLYKRNRLNENKNKIILRIETILIIISVFVLIYGFIDYYKYKKNNLGNKFRWQKFIFNNYRCHNDGEFNNFDLPHTTYKFRK